MDTPDRDGAVPTVPVPPAARPGTAASASTHTAPSGRIRGLDMARALAIVGMVMVHFGPVDTDPDTLSGFLYGLTHGRASILFIVLAGVGVSLLAGDRSRERLAGTTTRLLYRAAVLLPMGLALQALGTRVAVILQYYAVYFLIAAVAVRWRDRWLVVGAVAAAAIGPLAYLTGWFAEPSWYAPAPQPSLGEPVALVRDLLLTGYYPALVWAAPLLFGMWLGRRDLRDARAGRRLLVAGAAAAGAAYVLAWRLTAAVGAPPSDAASLRWLAVAEPHSEMPLWLAAAVGLAVATIGASMLLTDRFPRLTWPLVASGQLALTTYVGHLLLLWQFPEWFVRGTVAEATFTVARFTVLAVAAAALWRAVAARGPLESVLHLPFRGGRPARSGAATREGG